MTRDDAIDKIVRPVFEVVSGMAFQFRMMGLGSPDIVMHTLAFSGAIEQEFALAYPIEPSPTKEEIRASIARLMRVSAE